MMRSDFPSFVVTCLCLATVLSAAGCASEEPIAATADPAKEVYAAPGGWTGGEGTKEKPWDLATALSARSPIRPGGTVWLRGGVFKGAFVSDLSGTEQQPIVVRPMPGERVILDGAGEAGAVLTINGAWTIYRDFEVTNSDPRRTGQKLNRPSGVDVHGSNTVVANLVIHDTGGGIGMWSDAIDAEAYGNIIYYNGWVSAERPHGHGIYTQNKTGIRRITDNVVFGQFGIGMHAYGSEAAFLNDIQLEGNAIFNNGIPAGDFNVVLGGHVVANRPVLKNNFTYDNPGAGTNVGYAAGCKDLVMKDNVFASVKGGYAVQLVNCGGTLQNNTVLGNSRSIEGPAIATREDLVKRHPNNTFADPHVQTQTFVRANRYQPGRAHVIVYNWGKANDVDIDLTPLSLPVGADYEISDVRNLSTTLVSGTYSGGRVRVPMASLPVAPVIGWTEAPNHTAPEFAVFLVTSSPESPSALTSFFARIRGAVGL